MGKYFSITTGFFYEDDAVNRPDDAEFVSNELWAQLHAERAAGKRIVKDESGAFVAVDLEPPAISDQKKKALRIINAHSIDAVNSISSNYPQFEIDTWDAQEAEARAWLVDNDAPTPTLSPIAAVRGVAMPELVDRVIEKAELFRPVVAALIGKRQALEDQLDAASTQSEIEAVIAQARDVATWSIQ